MRRYKKNVRKYKIRRYKGKGLLGRDRRSWTPLYLSKKNQRWGFMNLVAAPYLAVPFLAKLLSKQ